MKNINTAQITFAVFVVRAAVVLCSYLIEIPNCEILFWIHSENKRNPFRFGAIFAVFNVDIDDTEVFIPFIIFRSPPIGRRLNGFLGLSLNDRTIIFLEVLLDKTVSVR